MNLHAPLGIHAVPLAGGLLTATESTNIQPLRLCTLHDNMRFGIIVIKAQVGNYINCCISLEVHVYTLVYTIGYESYKTYAPNSHVTTLFWNHTCIQSQERSI